MERISFSAVDNYLRDLVSKTDYIKEYISISPEELLSKLSSSKFIDMPILVFVGYEGKLTGNNQRTFGARTITFSILFHCSPDDFSGQKESYNSAEIYGLNLISRINLDSKVQKYAWLSNSFNKDSVIFDLAQYEAASGLFGCEFSFDLNIKDPLVVGAEFWNDIDDFCNYP